MSSIGTKITLPHESLTPIVGKPNYSSILQLKKELYANAKAIPSVTAGHAEGHLGVIMPDADYIAKTTASYEIPVNPAFMAAARTTVERAERAAAWETYTWIRQKLLNQIIAAVDAGYLTPFDTDEGIDGSPRDILTYLVNKYGKLKAADIEANEQLIRAPWNIDDTIATLWQRTERCRRIATAGGTPISDRAAIIIVMKILKDTGVFNTQLDQWREIPETEWTWNEFEEKFTTHDDTRLLNLTTSQAGYHAANAAKTPAKKEASTTTDKNPYLCGPLYYCWTHGFSRYPNHTSKTCKLPLDGHKKEATYTNPMGGYMGMRRGVIKPKPVIAAQASETNE